MSGIWHVLASLIPKVPLESCEKEGCSLSATFRRDGFVVIKGCLPKSVCLAVRNDLESEIGVEDPTGGENGRLHIPLDSSHSAMNATKRVVAARAGFFLDSFGGRGQLRTLGALVAFPNASRQEVHSDMSWTPDTLFATALVALQDVSMEM